MTKAVATVQFVPYKEVTDYLLGEAANKVRVSDSGCTNRSTGHGATQVLMQ